MDAVPELGGILQRYTEPDYDVELRRVFRTSAERVSAPAMAEALAAAFRASDLGFGELSACLFKHSDDGLRGRMISIFIPSLSAAAQEALRQAGLFVHSRPGPKVAMECMSDLSAEAVQVIAAEAEQSDLRVVDRVCDLYSRYPTITKYLPAQTLAAVLANVARQYGQNVLP